MLCFLQVQLKEQGKLIVDGENGKGRFGPGGPYYLGGGSGGVIQIISPTGRLPRRALSLKRGKKDGTCQPEAEHGYYYFVAGNFL